MPKENKGVAKGRIIFHVDMDQFYAAVEEQEHPEFKGISVIVGADPKEGKGRGVVSTCNYEARKYGVKSGIPISRAWKLCPDAVYIKPNYRLYTQASSRIMAILQKYTDKFEQWGLDEAFLDISLKIDNFRDARRLAEEIKREIYKKEKLACSTGVGPNKLVAKIASNFRKPNGITVVEESEVEGFLAPLPVRKLLWVGKKTARRLNEIGIKTIGDLAAFDVSVLTEKFGIMGAQYHLSSRGVDNSEVAERGVVKSVGRETTFEEDTSDFELVFETLDKLSQEIYEELVERKLHFKTVTIKIRFENFETHTHGKTLSFFTNNLQGIQKTARELIQPYLTRNRKIRLIGVRTSNFTSSREQKTLV